MASQERRERSASGEEETDWNCSLFGRTNASVPIAAKGVVTIGRAPENTICIDNPSVSPSTSRSTSREGVDEDLANEGTFVRNRQVVAREDTVGLRSYRETRRSSALAKAHAREVSIVVRRWLGIREPSSRNWSHGVVRDADEGGLEQGRAG